MTTLLLGCVILLGLCYRELREIRRLLEDPAAALKRRETEQMWKAVGQVKF